MITRTGLGHYILAYSDWQQQGSAQNVHNHYEQRLVMEIVNKMLVVIFIVAHRNPVIAHIVGEKADMLVHLAHKLDANDIVARSAHLENERAKQKLLNKNGVCRLVGGQSNWPNTFV
jgi:hypothetical protein